MMDEQFLEYQESDSAAVRLQQLSSCVCKAVNRSCGLQMSIAETVQ